MAVGVYEQCDRKDIRVHANKFKFHRRSTHLTVRSGVSEFRESLHHIYGLDCCVEYSILESEPICVHNKKLFSSVSRRMLCSALKCVRDVPSTMLNREEQDIPYTNDLIIENTNQGTNLRQIDSQ